MANNLVDFLAAANGEAAHIEGRIFFDHGLPATNLSVRLYNRAFGCAEIRLGETTTDERGFYTLAYEPTRTAANLEVRVVDADGKEVSLSATRYNAQSREVL